MVRMQDVAHRASVSSGTVSNYLNNPERVAPRTQVRVRRAIEDLGYVANTAARTLRVGSTRTIAHVAFEVDNPSFYELCTGIEERAREQNYSILVANSGGSSERESEYLAMFEAQRVRGMLLTPADDVAQQVTTLQLRGIPVVLVDRWADADVCSSVSVDDIAGGRLAVEHLVEQGRRRIVFAGGPLGLEPIAQRLAGARQAASAAGITLDVIDVDHRSIASGRDVGHRVTSLPPAERPDAVFAANDLLAIGVEHGLLQAGVRIPEDVAIVGYDDIEFAQNALIPLTSIRRPRHALGRTALDILLSTLHGRSHTEYSTVSFSPTLIPRASSAARGQH